MLLGLHGGEDLLRRRPGVWSTLLPLLTVVVPDVGSWSLPGAEVKGAEPRTEAELEFPV